MFEAFMDIDFCAHSRSSGVAAEAARYLSSSSDIVSNLNSSRPLSRAAFHSANAAAGSGNLRGRYFSETWAWGQVFGGGVSNTTAMASASLGNFLKLSASEFQMSTIALATFGLSSFGERAEKKSESSSGSASMNPDSSAGASGANSPKNPKNSEANSAAEASGNFESA